MCCTFLFTYRDFSKLTTTHWKLLFHRRRSSSVILFNLLLSLRLFSISLTLTAGRAFESAWLGGWRTTTDRHRQGRSNQFIEQQPPPYFKSFVFVAFIAALASPFPCKSGGRTRMKSEMETSGIRCDSITFCITDNGHSVSQSVSHWNRRRGENKKNGWLAAFLYQLHVGQVRLLQIILIMLNSIQSKCSPTSRRLFYKSVSSSVKRFF